MTTAPQPYERVTSFYSFEVNFPSAPKSGASLDAEFNAVRTTLNQSLTRLAQIQRDDGELFNGIVKPDALSRDVLVLMGNSVTPRGSWATATAYAARDMVQQDGISYLCVVGHTSGTFSADLAADRWQAITGASTAADILISAIGGLSATDTQAALAELQLNKQAVNANLTALVGLSLAANKLPYATGAGALALTDFTAFGRSLVDDADAAAARTTLGLSSAATATIGTAAGNLVALDGSAKLPAVDASQLINIQTAGLADGAVTANKLASTLDLSSKTITLPTANTPVFTKSFTSSELTISNAGGGSIAHSLGAVPKLIQVLLICKTAEQGYSIGDTVVWGTFWQAQDRGLSVGGDSTNITYRYAAQATPFSYLNKSTGASNALTNANWRVIIRAWA